MYILLKICQIDLAAIKIKQLEGHDFLLSLTMEGRDIFIQAVAQILEYYQKLPETYNKRQLVVHEAMTECLGGSCAPVVAIIQSYTASLAPAY